MGGAEGCEVGGRGRGMEGRWAGQRDVKKVGVVEGWEEVGHGRGMLTLIILGNWSSLSVLGNNLFGLAFNEVKNL